MRSSVACDGQVSDNPKQFLPLATGRFRASHSALPGSLSYTARRDAISVGALRQLNANAMPQGTLQATSDVGVARIRPGHE